VNLSVTNQPHSGIGTIVGSTIVGSLMTRDYKAAEESYKAQRNLPATYKLPAKNLPVDFNIEHARQRNLPWITGVFVLSVGAYGFTLSSTSLTSLPGWIVVPLLFQFLIAATSNAVFAINTTLVSDLCPGKGASSTAINNLVRCGLGAVGVAFGETMIAAVGAGAAFLGLALITIACVPLAVVNWYYGMHWKTARIARVARLEEERINSDKA
jgi:MFS family permease